MCSVCIAGDGSGRTLQCGWRITPSSSQPLSLTTSALQHSCCPACSIADTGVSALACGQACYSFWLRHQLIGALFSFCKSWAKTVEHTPKKKEKQHVNSPFFLKALTKLRTHLFGPSPQQASISLTLPLKAREFSWLMLFKALTSRLGFSAGSKELA